MKRSTIWLVVIVVVIVVIFFLARDRQATDQAMAYDGFELRDAGLNIPESVLYDSASDCYLVSNINGAPTDVDGNGYISRVSPDGTIKVLKWIDGETEGVVLSAPKGMALIGKMLYVTDITAIRIFDVDSGEMVGSVDVPGATFLNDITPDGMGGIYFTDSGLNPDFTSSGSDAVWHLDADESLSEVVKSTDLMGPNGILLVDGMLYVVPFGGNKLMSVTTDGVISTVTNLPTGGLDGIVKANDGRFLISSWEGQTVYAVDSEGVAEALITDVPSPADIGYDVKRNLVLIPLFNESAVAVVPVEVMPDME